MAAGSGAVGELHATAGLELALDVAAEGEQGGGGGAVGAEGDQRFVGLARSEERRVGKECRL